MTHRSIRNRFPSCLSRHRQSERSSAGSCTLPGTARSPSSGLGSATRGMVRFWSTRRASTSSTRCDSAVVWRFWSRWLSLGLGQAKEARDKARRFPSNRPVRRAACLRSAMYARPSRSASNQGCPTDGHRCCSLFSSVGILVFLLDGQDTPAPAGLPPPTRPIVLPSSH